MSSPRLRQGRLQAVFVAFTLVFFGLVVWQIQAHSPNGEASKEHGSRVAAQPGSTVPVIDQVSSSQRSGFSIFRSPPEGLPIRVTASLHQPSYGMNWALAQRIPTNAGPDFWAVPGRSAICIVGQETIGIVTVNCGTTRRAVTHGIAAVLLREDPSSASLGSPRGQRLIFGLAPDGFSSIRVYTDGSFAQIPVKRGTFTLRDGVMEPPTAYRPSRG